MTFDAHVPRQQGTPARNLLRVPLAGLVLVGSLGLATAAPGVVSAAPPVSCLGFDSAGATGVMSCDVPAGVTVLRFVADGAGGGGAGGTASAGAGGAGGSGARVTYDISVTAGETLTLEVGTGGGATSGRDGAGGGGWTAVKRGATIIMVAAGGGGAGSDGTLVAGGDASEGGTATGGDGKSDNSDLFGGEGATTSAAGAGGLCVLGCAGPIYNGSAGIQYEGGDGSDQLAPNEAGQGASTWQGGAAGTSGLFGTGGGGGAGYYGGGGGASRWFALSAGGGAGSSYPATGATYATAGNGGAVNTAGGNGSITISTVPAPTVSSVSPSSGSTAGGTTVTITGTNFASGATVTIGGVAATGVTVVSATEITAVTPAGAAGVADITVTNPIGLSGTGSALFTYSSSGGSGGSGSLEPIAPGTNPAIPVGGLGAGESVLLVDGVATPVTVRPNSAFAATRLVISARGLVMRLEGRGDTSDPLGLTPKQALILQSQQVAPGSVEAFARRVQPYAVSSGGGFKRRSPVKFYLLPDVYLGQLTTDRNGRYSGRIPIPPGIAPGIYTMQVNGFAPDGSVRSLSLGVRVQETRGTATTSVYFVGNSPELTERARATLRSIADTVGFRAVTVSVEGFVRPTGGTRNDLALSFARARNVARHLQSLGVTGRFTTRGLGRDSQPVPGSRRVDVTIVYLR